MSISVANFLSGGLSGSTSALSSSSWSATSGNTIAVGFRVDATTMSVVSGVTDTAGNSYTPVTGSQSSQTNQAIQFWYSVGITGNASNVVTVHLPGGQSFTGLAIWEIAGVGSLDSYSEGVGSTGSQPTANSFSTVASNTIVCCIASISNTGLTWTAGSGYTLDGGSSGFPGSGNQYCSAQHQIFSSVQTGITPAMTVSSANAPVGISVVAFAAGSPPVTNKFIQTIYMGW